MSEKYTDKFNAFWKAYPRKTAKITAFKAWVKQGIEDDAFLPTQIQQDLEKRTRYRWWPSDSSKIPHGATWINQRRWEDEGWEDEIAKREGEKPNTGPVRMPEVKDDGPMLSGWELMLNRVMRNYLLKAGGFTDEQLQKFVAIKKRVWKQVKPVIDEELAAENTPDKKKEMAYLLASTAVNHLDHELCMNLGPQVIKMGRVR